MTEQLTVTTVRVDDIPVLLSQSERMGIPELLDAHFKSHGNWEGMSLGWSTAVWLTHIVSEGDHRVNQVQPWVEQRLQTLQTCSGQEVCGGSFQHAGAATAALQARVTKAQAALAQLTERKQGKKHYDDAASLQQAAQAILKAHRVDGLLTLTITEHAEERPVRAYGARPATLRLAHSLHLRVTVDEPALAAAIRRLGWRVYATNHLQQTLPLAQAVLAYRGEYLVERDFGRLKGKPLSLSPMYVQSDQRVTGLIRLLSLALRLLTLLEFQTRQRLADRQDTLPGLYAGNPKRTTSRPTAEALLKAFQLIHLSVVTIGEQVHCHLTPLSPLQLSILSLLDLSPSLYDRLCAQSLKPT